MPFALKIALLSLAASVSAPSYKAARSFPAASIARVMLTNYQGDVAVQASSAPEAQLVTRLISGDSSRCEVSARLEGDLLVIEAPRSRKCRVDMELRVPPRVDLESVTGSGDLRVRGTHGPVRVRTGSGDVHLDSVVTQLTASLGSGDLRATHLEGDANVRQGSGSSTLQCQGRGTLQLRVGAGDVDVLVPRRAAVEHHLTVGAGEVRMLAAASSDPDWLVRGSVGAGQVVIRNAS